MTTPKPPDSDATPVEGAIKRSSGSLRLDLHDCPKCGGKGYCGPFPQPPSETMCDLCLGARKVTLSVATGWILSHSSNPPPPDTERER